MPFVVTLPLSGIMAAIAGVAIGVPTLRMSGLYLAIATLAFGSIVQHVFSKWSDVTGGFDGLAVKAPALLGYTINDAGGAVLPVPRRAAVRAVDLGQRAALADRARHDGDPRQRGLGPEHGHQPRPV